MNYRSVAQLSDQVLQWSGRMPHHFDLIVGVPRSGLLVGNLLALYRNLPLTDVEGLIEARTIATGRRPLRPGREGSDRPLRVLVVDDSVRRGDALREVRERIRDAGVPHQVEYGAVYVVPGAEKHVDFHCEVLDDPRVFEWNILHHERLTRACVDLDGVVSGGVRPGTEPTGQAAAAALAPRYVPTRGVGWLVTARSEEDREPTEGWLKAHGICYRELIMLGVPQNTARDETFCEAAAKAEVYRRTGAELFIERSLHQAVQIANIALKPAFCFDTMQMVYPGTRPYDRYTAPRSSPVQTGFDSLRRQLRRSLAPYRVTLGGSRSA
jgi:orotate phosphoribosyltransferase